MSWISFLYLLKYYQQIINFESFIHLFIQLLIQLQEIEVICIVFHSQNESQYWVYGIVIYRQTLISIFFICPEKKKIYFILNKIIELCNLVISINLIVFACIQAIFDIEFHSWASFFVILILVCNPPRGLSIWKMRYDCLSVAF